MAGERTDWRNLLPYCHRYLQETWFFGAEKDLRVPMHWAKPDPQNQPDSDDWRVHLDETVRLEGISMQIATALLKPSLLVIYRQQGQV